MATNLSNAKGQKLPAFLGRVSRPLSACNPCDLRRLVEPRTAPATICQSLSKNKRTGLAQRVATIRATIARPRKAPAAPIVLAMCDSCDAAEQMAEPATIQAVTDAVTRSGFHPARPAIKLHGQVTRCAPDTDPTRSAPR